MVGSSLGLLAKWDLKDPKLFMLKGFGSCKYVYCNKCKYECYLMSMNYLCIMSD